MLRILNVLASMIYAIPSALAPTDCEIRLAQLADLDAVLAIVAETVVQMKAEGSDQWDAAYPDRDRFQQDVGNTSLYVADFQGEVVGFVVADQEQPEEYAPLPWSPGECLVLHRSAIALSHRRQGLASMLEAFVCGLARSQGIDLLKTDTYSANAGMQAFFEKLGYRKVGEMALHDKARPFYCYEKALSSP